MLFILLIAIADAQIYTHTFLVLDQSPTIGMPNHLNRQIFDTNKTVFPNLDSQQFKKSILNSNFSTYMQNVKFTYGKTKQNAETIMVANQAIVIYYQYQNLLSIEELKLQYQDFKKCYLTDELIILVQSKMEKQVSEYIFLTNNPGGFVAEYSQKLKYIEKNQTLNILQETNKLIYNKSQCLSMNQFIKTLTNYEQYELLLNRFHQMDQIQKWIDGWLLLNNTEFAQLLFDQQMSQTQDLINNIQTTCQEDVYFEIENYQCSMIAVFLIIFVLIQHFVKVMNMSDKDKFV